MSRQASEDKPSSPPESVDSSATEETVVRNASETNREVIVDETQTNAFPSTAIPLNSQDEDKTPEKNAPASPEVTTDLNLSERTNAEATVAFSGDNANQRAEGSSREGNSPTLEEDAFSDHTTETRIVSAEQLASLSDDEEVSNSLDPSVKYLGQYEIRRKLGAGAFGNVYLGYDPNLERLVAIKVAKMGKLPDEGDVNRFMREGKAAARLRHPNIVSVHEIGQSQGGYYIAYDFVDGVTLKQRIKSDETFTQAETATLIRKIAGALGYAHQQKIVHRDIKPENIMLDAAGEPHILDFGLARGDELDTTRTRDGSMLGSPAYMSPEQASGKSHEADGRADIWSLGVTMYEMLCGKRPFRGDVSQVIFKVRNQPEQLLTKLDRNIDRDLATICHKCLTKERGQRFQTGEELAEEIARWERGEPIRSRKIGFLQRMWRLAKRNPQTTLLTLAIFASLLLGTIVSSIMAAQARSEHFKLVAEQQKRVRGQIESLIQGKSMAIPTLIETLENSGEDLTEPIQDELTSRKLSNQGRLRLLVAIMKLKPTPTIDQSRLLPNLRTQHTLIKQLLPLWLEADANEFLVIKELLPADSYDELAPGLWRILDEGNRPPAIQLRAFAGLARIDPESPRWPDFAPTTASLLQQLPTQTQSSWCDAFLPVRVELQRPLTTTFLSAASQMARGQAAEIIGQLYVDDPEFLLKLIESADDGQLHSLLHGLDVESKTLREWSSNAEADLNATLTLQQLKREVQRQSNVTLALLGLGEYEMARERLARLDHPDLWTAVMCRFSLTQLEPAPLIPRLDTETDPRMLYHLMGLLKLSRDYLSPLRWERDVEPVLKRIKQSHAHAGVATLAEWSSRPSDDEKVVIEPSSAAASIPESNSWPVISDSYHRIQMIKLPTPARFQMGATAKAFTSDITDSERVHLRDIPRMVSISSTEITIEQFTQRMTDWNDDRFRIARSKLTDSEEAPMTYVTWYDAVKFCRRLSEEAGIDESQMCYPPVDQIGPGMNLPEDWIDKTGYRLPTAAEWEFACRAGTDTANSFGNLPTFADRFVCLPARNETVLHPVGRKMPNPFGLYDTQGNAMEWVHDLFVYDYPTGNGDPEVVIDPVEVTSRLARTREARGFDSGGLIRPEAMRASFRYDQSPVQRDPFIGFRVARTLELHKN